MATLTFNLTPAELTELVACECFFNNYQPIINGSANPESMGQFARRKQIEFMKGRVVEYRKQLAAKAAADAASAVEPGIT